MTTPTARALGEPIVDDGIRWLNFFNGRMLSAEDLAADQVAIGRARHQLGRAQGAGVVSGLGVREDEPRNVARPVLTVDPGLAINLEGRTLELGRRVTIGLVRVDAPSDLEGADFARCDVVLAGTAGLGAYLLSVGPAAADAGMAVVAGLGNDPAACNTAYTVEGVRFQLFPVDIEPEDVDDAKLRNRLAYRMFGAGDARSSMDRVEPFTAREGARSELDDLQAACLGTTDVALALIFWQPGEGIDFVDEWSVRRRSLPPSPGTIEVTPWRDAAIAEGEARYLQLEAHLRDRLVRESQPGAVKATDTFQFLPAAGVLPIATTVSRGFTTAAFFDGLKTRGPAFIEAALVPDLLRESLAFPPIDLSSGRVIWTYLVRENAQQLRIRQWRPDVLVRPDILARPEIFARPDLFGRALAGDAVRIGEPVPYLSGAPAPSCLVFTTGDMRYRADARYDLGYWDYANFAEID